MEKPERNTADLLVECLIEEGVEYIFGIPGEENLALMNAIYDSPIKFITVRHEQGAAFMADVYGRLTGKAGVCLSTLGPGATNLITGVADAYSDGAPLVAITGQVGTERMHITSHQFLDLTKMFEPITKRTKMVVRPDTINKLYQPEVEVVGDISDSLLQIGRRTARHQEPEKALEIKARMIAEHESYAGDASFPMKPQRILQDVRKVMGKDDIVISDVGAHKMWIARHYQCYEPNTCIISNGFATMGISVPGAIGARLVYPDKKILAICGDGGFMMNCQEFETALRAKTPFVTLIFNDSSYGLIKWKQMDQYHKNCYVDFTNPDFVKFAESMGAIGYRIEKAEDLVPTLEKAFQQKVPVIIDCPVDYSENTKLTVHLEELMKEL